MPNPLTPAQFAAYKRVHDFSSRFNTAVRAIYEAWGLDASAPGRQIGEGVQQLPRTVTTWAFEVGGASGSATSMPQDFGAGAYRNPIYAEREGTLTFAVTAPFETQEKLEAEFSEDHVRALDERCAELEVVFIQGLFPFTATSAGDVLPDYDVLDLQPIEPDERPEELREVNIARRRYRVSFRIRETALAAAASAT